MPAKVKFRSTAPNITMNRKHHSHILWATDANILYTIIGTTMSRFVSCIASVFAVEAAKAFLPGNVLATHQNSALLWFILSVGTASRILYVFLAAHLSGKLSYQEENLLFTFLIPLTSLVLAWLPDYQTIGITSTIIFTLCHVVLGICAGAEAPAIAFRTIRLHQHKHYASMILSISTSLGIYLLTLTNTRTHGLRFVYLIGAFLGLIGLGLRLSLMSMITIWQDEPSQAQTASSRHANHSISLILHNTRRFIPLFIGLALFSQTYLHATGKGWKEAVERFNYGCASQSKTLISVSVITGVCFKILASILGEKYGTTLVFLSGCWLSLLTLPLLYYFSYWNYPALGLIVGAVPAAIFQCLVYKYKTDIAHHAHLMDIATCWNLISSVVNVLAAPLFPLLCFDPKAGLPVFILCSSFNSLFILYSHQQLQSNPDMRLHQSG